MKNNETLEKNKALCEKYRFLAWPDDEFFVDGQTVSKPTYEGTWEDDLPEGWKKAFCPQMWDELKEAIILDIMDGFGDQIGEDARARAEYLYEHNLNDYFSWAEIKEKYGALRLYCRIPGAHVESWVNKYERLSEDVCIHCGKPAKYMTFGWITFICEDCAKQLGRDVIALTDIDAYYDASPEDKDKFRKKL